jgi:hypothetical protein
LTYYIFCASIRNINQNKNNQENTMTVENTPVLHAEPLPLDVLRQFDANVIQSPTQEEIAKAHELAISRTPLPAAEQVEAEYVGRHRAPEAPSNPDRLISRSANWAARSAGRIADISYRVHGFSNRLGDAADEHFYDRTARAADAVAGGAGRITNLANRINDKAEAVSDRFADRRTTKQTVTDGIENAKVTVQEKVTRGRTLARRVGRAIRQEAGDARMDAGAAVRENIDTVKSLGRENVQKARTHLKQRAEAAQLRQELRTWGPKTETQALKDNVTAARREQFEHRKRKAEASVTATKEALLRKGEAAKQLGKLAMVNTTSVAKNVKEGIATEARAINDEMAEARKPYHAGRANKLNAKAEEQLSKVGKHTSDTSARKAYRNLRAAQLKNSAEEHQRKAA